VTEPLQVGDVFGRCGNCSTGGNAAATPAV